MPLTGAQYVKRDADDILSFLESEMRNEFGRDIDLTESSAFKTFATAIAEVDSTQVEEALEEVHRAGFIDKAEGDNLDNLLELLGLVRQAATNATGTVEFRSSDTVTADHTIPNGIQVQTDSADPTVYETTELVQMFLRDDFEDGSLDARYAGDTAAWTVVDGSSSTPDPLHGDWMLNSDATGDIQINDDLITTYIGHTQDFYVWIPAGGHPKYRFGFTDVNNTYQVSLDPGNTTHGVEKLEGGVLTVLQEDTTISVPTGEWLRIEVSWLPDDNGTIQSRIYRDTDGDDVYDELFDEQVITDENTFVRGGYGFYNDDATEVFFDWVADRAVEGDARAVDSGSESNIGANSLTVTATAVSGVDSVTNRNPMGDADFFLTSLDAFTIGRPEESDEAFRERAKRSEGQRGFATAKAVLAELTAVDGVQSVALFENKTNTDNTGSGGLPPKSFEAVVFGKHGDQDIADSLFEVKGFTARDYGGANGTAVSETVEAENGQTYTLNWSEPTAIAVDMTLDLVVNADYIGDDNLRDRIVEFIGGTKVDGSTALGIDVGEDVYIDQLYDEIVGPRDTGVVGVDDAATSFTPSATTDANGLDIVDIGSGEVAETDGQDGSITITTTTV